MVARQHRNHREAWGPPHSDDRRIWCDVTIRVPVPYPHDGDGHICFLFYAICPECSTIGIKLNHDPEFSSDFDPDPYIRNVKNATRIHPLKTPERREIALDGVPESHCSACRKALIALDHPDLHEYANILARRSLEAILRTEYNGNTLAALIDTMLQDKESGLSRGLLKNIDAIRNLGNIGAHDIPGNAPEPLRADKEQTSWNITVWERFLDEWFVRPTQDAAQLGRLKEAGLKVKEPEQPKDR